MTDKNNSWHVSYGVYGAIGFQLAISVVAGLVFGNYLDKKIGTTPWCTLIGLILGSVAGFYNLVKIMNWHQTKKGNDDRPSHSDSA